MLEYQLDVSSFNAMLRKLAELSGKEMADVIRQQAGKVLEICLKRTVQRLKLSKQGGLAGIQKKVQLRIEKPARYVDDSGTKVVNNNVPRPMSTPFLQTLTGTRGGFPGGQYYIGRDRKGKRLILPGAWLINWPKFQNFAAVRGGILMALEPKIAVAKAAVGALPKSWLAIADKLGVDIKVSPGFIRRARMPADFAAGSRMVITDAAAFAELVLTNEMLISRYNAYSILQGAIKTRLSAFAHELKKDVFNDLKTRAQRYPGIFVAPA